TSVVLPSSSVTVGRGRSLAPPEKRLRWGGRREDTLAQLRAATGYSGPRVTPPVSSSEPSPAVWRSVKLPSSFSLCRQAHRTGYLCPFTSISAFSRRPCHFVPLGSANFACRTFPGSGYPASKLPPTRTDPSARA